MAETKNIFLGSKMNKDLDSRIISKKEYRNAVNIQVSRSEGSDVGAVENVLGNRLVSSFSSLTGVSDIYCIGYFSDEASEKVYLFFTDYLDGNPLNYNYNPNANSFICLYDSKSEVGKVLVSGAFLNFSKSNPIYGINLLEDLLFFTDNRNQPRVINVKEADKNSNFYTSEDQISVAKYYPYQSMELYQESILGGDDTYETTMYDVFSKFYPTGGSCLTSGAVTPASTTFSIDNIKGSIQPGTLVSGYLSDGSPIPPNVTVVSYISPDLEVSAALELSDNTELIFNANPYYDPKFSGDSDYLKDKFVRFSYRFKYIDNEYSLMAPFTQITFIPQQDGYFMYDPDAIFPSNVDDEKSTYRSTIVDFMENKINQIFLRIPLPYSKLSIENDLKIKSIEILYKESDQVPVKVVEEIEVNNISNTYAICSLNGSVTASNTLIVDNVQGGIRVGEIVSGIDVVYGTKVVSYNPETFTLIVDKNQTLLDDTLLAIGEEKVFSYVYKSKKPYKTLAESENIRVYDKIPVRSLSQEVVSNRVVYGNFQNKNTPPSFLDYNVAASPKTSFSLNRTKAEITNSSPTSGTTITVTPKTNTSLPPNVGDFITILTGAGVIPEDTQVISVTLVGSDYVLVLSNAVSGLTTTTVILFQPGGDTINTTSIIEYPNHNLKENRSYQAGVVLSDRYGRSTSVILSNNESKINVGLQEFIGSTIYSPYRDESTEPSQWPGDSLKIIFNSPISPINPNHAILAPGVYNGDPTSPDYNPLGFHSFKIVVKQTEQEYYNAYLPGVMAAYPETNGGDTLEVGKTSHAVLINDNIYKIPRDLSEVGPEQRQFRSSVKLFGRVENITSGGGDANVQFYPGRNYNIVSTVSNMQDLFEPGNINTNQTDPASPTDPPTNDAVPYLYDAGFFQFYLNEANPLIARISTNSQFGVVHSSNDVINLAILETDPVESLLDIFWETSTSGLVSDLNNAILDDSGGSATLFGFNTSGWDEGDAIGTNITNTPFNFLNNQGINIDPTLIESVELESVYDNTSSNQNRLNEFNLSYNSSTGFSNISTNALFSYNQDQAERIFTFTIKVVMTNGEEVLFVESDILLGNQVPVIIECSGGSAQDFNLDTSDDLITTFTGHNGSAFFGIVNEKYKAGADLTWSFESVERISGETQDGVDSNFENGIYAGLISIVNTVIPQQGSQVSTVEIQKSGVILGGFRVTIKLEDANGDATAGSDSTTCSFDINVTSAGEVSGLRSRWRAYGKSNTLDVVYSEQNFGKMVDGITVCQDTTVFRADGQPTIWNIEPLADIQSNNNLFYGSGPGQYAEFEPDGTTPNPNYQVVQNTPDIATVNNQSYPLQGTEQKFFAADPQTGKFTKLIGCGVVVYNNLSGEIQTKLTSANLEREPNNSVYDTYTVQAGEEIRFASGRMIVAYQNNNENNPCNPPGNPPVPYEFPPGSGLTRFIGYNVCNIAVPWGTMYEITSACTSGNLNGNLIGCEVGSLPPVTGQSPIGAGSEIMIQSAGFVNHGQGYQIGSVELWSNITNHIGIVKVGTGSITNVTSQGEVMKFVIDDIYISTGRGFIGYSADNSPRFDNITLKQPSSTTPVFSEINVNAGIGLCAYFKDANGPACIPWDSSCPEYTNNTITHSGNIPSIDGQNEIGTFGVDPQWC